MSSYYLVKYSNCDDEYDFITFLKTNEFRCEGGNYGCPWVFVDIKRKIYKPGRPGVSYGSVIGNREITILEFIKIYKNHYDKKKHN